MLAKVLNKVFPKTIRRFREDASYEQRKAHEKYERDRKLEVMAVEEKLYTGERVIVFGNDYADPIVAKIVAYESFKKPHEEQKHPRHLPIIENVLTGQHHVTFGIMVKFHPDRLKTLIEMGPDMRWSLLAGSMRMQDHYALPREEGTVLSTYDDFIEKLTECGFLTHADFIKVS